MWWIPGAEGRRVAGTLDFSPDDGLKLALLGGLSDSKDLDDKRFSVVHGALWECPYGSKVSLRDCFAVQLKMAAGLPPRESYHAGRAYIGAHLEDFTFFRARIRFAGLPVWVGLTGTTHGILEDKKGIRIEYRQPEPIRGDIKQGSLAIGINGNASFKRYGDWTITERPEVKMQFASPRTSEDIHADFVFPLRNLAAMALVSNAGLESCRLTPIDSEEEVEELGAMISGPPLESPKESDRLFGLTDIQDPIQLIDSWLQFSSRYPEILAPFFNVNFYRRDDFVDVRFQNTAYSMMALYRTINGNARSWNPDDWRLSFESMLGQFDKGGDLFQDPGAAGSKIMELLEHIIHRTPLAWSDEVGLSLYHFNEKLKWLMIIFLLTQVGTPLECQQNRQYQHAASLPLD